MGLDDEEEKALQKLIDRHLHDAKVLDSVTNYWGEQTRLAQAAEHRETARLYQMRLGGMARLRRMQEAEQFVHQGTATIAHLGIGTAGLQVAAQGARMVQLLAEQAARVAQLNSTKAYLAQIQLARAEVNARPMVVTESAASLRAKVKILTTEADNIVISEGFSPQRTARYGTLTSELKGTGSQANHLNQDAAYGSVIPHEEGLSIGMRGDAFREKGSAHYEFHRSLERFWDPYRKGGVNFGQTPTNAQYGAAMEQALISAGYTAAEAKLIGQQAAAQRASFGLPETAPVPRIPGRLPQQK